MKKFNGSFDKIFEAIFFILLVIYVAIGLVTQNIEVTIWTCVTILMLIGLRVFSKITQIVLTPFLNITVLGFIFLAMFLGNINNFYDIYHWDTILHTSSGFLTFLLGYMVFLYFNNSKIDNINNFVIVLFVLFFSISCAALWEIWEFSGDQLLGLNSQLSLFDTMKDIITGIIIPLFLCPFLNRYLTGNNNKLFNELTCLMTHKRK